MTYKKGFLVFLMMVGGSGCEKTKEVFGLQRQEPDEFSVYNRPPLSAPTNLILKPPVPGQAGPEENAVQERAQRAVLGGRPVKGPRSGLESELLEKAGALGSQGDIRRTLAEESRGKKSKKGPLNKVLFWQKATPKGDVIDPHEEHKKQTGEDHPSKQPVH